jgi:hypothetical protein
MSRQEIPGLEIQGAEIPGAQLEGSGVQGSEVQGSGRVFFALAKTVVDLIDDELTVSDYNKCAGTKVSMSSRWLRVGAGAVHKVSKAQAQKKLGSSDVFLNEIFGAIGS